MQITCCRQWEMHHALYIAQVSDAVGTIPRSPQAQLALPLLTQKLILENPRCKGEVSTGDARFWVRNKLVKRGVNDVAKAVLEAVIALAAAGLVNIQDPVEPPLRRVKRRVSGDVPGQQLPCEVPAGHIDSAQRSNEPILMSEQIAALEEVQPSSEETSRRRHGRATRMFSKRAWSEIIASESAQEHLVTLGVTVDHFA